MEGTIKIIIVNYCHHLISSIRSPQLRANLIPEHNLWFAVFDFNDDAKTGKNWKLLENESEWEPCWCPLGEFENCCPKVTKGSIALPSQSGDGMGGGVTLPSTQAAPPTGSGGMMSFGFDTSLHDAAVATGDAFVAQEVAASGGGGAVPKPPEKKKSGIGWNPGAFAEPAEAAAPVAEKPKKKSGVGWNPGAFAEPAVAAAPVAEKPKKKSGVGWNPGAFAEPAPEAVPVEVPTNIATAPPAAGPPPPPAA